MPPPFPYNIDARGATITNIGGDQFNTDMSMHNVTMHNITHNNNGDATFNSTNNTNYYVIYAVRQTLIKSWLRC
jgi:hypothetical protein